MSLAHLKGAMLGGVICVAVCIPFLLTEHYITGGVIAGSGFMVYMIAGLLAWWHHG